MKNAHKVVTGVAALAGALSLGQAKNVQADTTATTVKPVASQQMKTVSTVAKTVPTATSATGDAKTTAENIKTTTEDQKIAGDDLTWAKQNVADATPANIQKNQDAQAAVTTKIATDQTAEKTANDQLTSAQASQQTAQNDVDAANQTVAEKQATVDQAQKDVAKKQAAVNDDQQKITTAQSDVAAAKQRTQTNAQATSTAQTTANQAQQAVTAKQADQAQATTDLAAAKQATKPAQDAVTAAQKAQQSAQAAVETTQAKINTATATTEKQSTLTLAPGVNNALFEKYEDATNVEAATTSTQAVLGKTSQIASNHYQSNAVDKVNTVADLDHLTSAQQLDLTLFAANIINQVRIQMGNLKVAVTADSVKFANDVAKRYVADKWSQNGHDVAGIGAVAETFGLSGEANYYENLSNGYLWNTGSMDGLKAGVYSTILDMIADDSDSGFGHTESMTGHNSGVDTDYQQYFGAAVDSMGQVHLLLVTNSPAYIEVPGKFNMTNTIDLTPASKTDITALTAQLASQKAALATAKQNVATKQATLKPLQARQDQAQTALTQINAALTKLNDQLTSAQGQVAQLKQQKVTDAAMIANAPATLAALQAQLARDVQALDAAKPILAQAQAALATAQTTAAQKQANLDVAKEHTAVLAAILADAQSATQSDQDSLDALTQQLFNYQNADQILSAVQDIYTQVSANLTKLQAHLTELQTASPDQVQVTQADHGQTVMQLTHHAKRVSVTLPAVKAASAAADQLAHGDDALPQTNEQATSPLSLLGIALLGLVGLGYASLRRKFQ